MSIVHTFIALKSWKVNKMSEWHCFKCKQKMVEEEIPVSYLDLDGEAEGLKCPQCGVQYIMEDYVIEKMLKGEKMIEEK